MKRRDFVTSVLVGGLAIPVIGDQQRGQEKEKEKDEERGEGNGHGGRHERLTNATVSFGHWLPTPDYRRTP